MFKVGDKVWCMLNRWGEVMEINTDNSLYPVYVEFEDKEVRTYTTDGKFSIDSNRTLFFEEIPIIRKRWRAEEGEFYYYITDKGYINFTYDGRSGNDNHRYDSGNYFQTEKEAEEANFKLFKKKKKTVELNVDFIGI